jgi:ADP-ribose pyrophosphatase YjhB (NUDIX family)
MAMTTCDLGVAARVVNDGKILLVCEAKGAFAGKWGLPKGYVEPGETPESAVTRELKEETGYSGHILGLAGLRTAHRDNGCAIFLTYDVSVENEDHPYDSNEIQETRWCSLSDLIRLEFISETMYQLAIDGLDINHSTLPGKTPLSKTGEMYKVYSCGHLLNFSPGGLS